MIFFLFFFLLITPAAAHEWYDTDCCSGKDCAPIVANSVESTPDGWRVKETGEVFPYEGNPKVRQSKNNQFHRCVRKDGTTRCLYVPEPGL